MLDRMFLLNGAGADTDPNFENVTLLLPGNGSNGAQNNTFLDGSTNNFTMTRVGNTTQGSFSAYGNLWSNYFDGTGDYLTTPSSAAFAFGTGDFTVEAWVFITATDTALRQIWQNGAADNCNVYRSTTGFAAVWDGTNRVSTTPIPSNVWTHLALTRSGTTARLFVNGVQAISWTSSVNYSASSVWYVGYNVTATQLMFGYISNLRIVKGTAVYTAAFTPPTEPLTAITNTSLLTCQSNRFRDASSNNFAITLSGNPSITNFTPFNPTATYSPAITGGSGYFDGAGDYLTPVGSTAVNFGTGDFTVELWVYATTGDPVVFDGRSGSAQNAITIQVFTTTGQVVFYNNDGTSRISGSGFIANTWHHIAVTRSGTSTRLFLNGTQLGSTFTDASSYVSGTNRPAVGAAGFGLGGSALTGYISNLRVVKGTAVYTANFTPPTAPVTAITNTSLLLNFTNAGIVDASTKNDLGTVGNAQISTAQSKFGGSSMAFDGTGDWLIAPHTVGQQLGTGNFTVEGWLYLSATGAARGIVGKGTATTGWLLSINATNNVVFTYGSSTITSATALTGATWYYLAVVREGTGTNQTKIYVNGTNNGTGTVSTDFSQTNVLYVGANRTGGDALNGYIDDLRITKGLARYTTNFTSPSAPFPTA